jgi:serine/threonine protein kinase
MGTVYLAFDTRLQREVALKIPHLSANAKTHLIERFLRESRAGSQVHHPNICPIYDVDSNEGIYYLTMAFIRGPSLAAFSMDNEISPREAVTLVEKIARALNALHKAGVLHRDIKPSNILLDPSGEPLLTDFGLAGHIERDDSVDANDLPDERFLERGGSLTQTGTIIGTRHYMAPELLRGELASVQSDIYSLGVVLCELLSGARAISSGESSGHETVEMVEIPKQKYLRPEVDKDLTEICSKALCADPHQRYASAEELAEAMHGYLSADAFPSKQPPRRWMVWRLAIAILALSAGILLFLKTGQGTLEIHVDESDIKVIVDQKEVELSGNSTTLELSIGSHHVEAVRDGCDPYSETVVLNWRGGTATIEIRPKNKYITRWIGTEKDLGPIDLSPDGKKIYALSGELGKRSKVFVYDYASGQLLDTFSSPDETYDHKGIVVSKDHRYVFVTNYHYQHDDLSNFDLLKKDHPSENIGIGGTWSSLIKITPDGSKLAVAAGMDGRNVDEGNDRFIWGEISEGQLKKSISVDLPDEPIQGSLVFSDDSRYAYFLTRPRKSSFPMLLEVALTDPCEVTRRLELPGGDLKDLAINSHEKKIFISDAGQCCLRVVDLSTFREAASIAIGKIGPDRLALSAGCDLLAVLCPDRRKILIIDPSVGTILETLSGLDAQVFDLRFTPDGNALLALRAGEKGGIAVIELGPLLLGRRLVFCSDRSGDGYQLYLANPGGPQIRSFRKSKGIDCSPRWSPDGRLVAFLSNEQGMPKIFLARRDGRIWKILEKTDPVFDKMKAGLFGRPFDWSPDGKEIVFIGGDRTCLRVVDIDSGNIRTLAEGRVLDEYGKHMSVSWRHSRDSLLFSSQHPASSEQFALIRLDIKEKTFSAIYRSAGRDVRYAQAEESGDGKEIVCLQYKQRIDHPSPLLKMNADGSDPRVVRGVENGENAFPCWTRDKREIFYSALIDDYYHLYRVDGGIGRPEQLFSGKWNDVQADAWGNFSNF